MCCLAREWQQLFEAASSASESILLSRQSHRLITRAEVQSAFQQVAQIEAQRMQQEQAARAQARQSQVFNTERIDKASAMNQQINEQLAALGERAWQQSIISSVLKADAD